MERRRGRYIFALGWRVGGIDAGCSGKCALSVNFRLPVCSCEADFVYFGESGFFRLGGQEEVICRLLCVSVYSCAFCDTMKPSSFSLSLLAGMDITIDVFHWQESQEPK